MKKFLLSHLVLFALLSIVIAGIGIRLYKFSSVPPGFYWEEAALGYDAYSVMLTGNDHHGTHLPLLSFESFGDWKPPLYFYAAIPSIYAFGLTPFAVRLPSLVAGVLLIIGVFVFGNTFFNFDTKIRFSNKKTTNFPSIPVQIGLVAALLVAIEPWTVHFSRAAWEANVATALLLWGTTLIFFAVSKHTNVVRIILSLLSGLFLGLSMYTYHAARFIAPALFLLSLMYMLVHLFTAKNAKELKRHFLMVLVTSGAVLFLFATPIALKWNTIQISGRFETEGIFSSQTAAAASITARTLVGDSIFSRIIFHRYIFLTQEMLAGFTDHLDLSFLFLRGDDNLRHSLQGMGLLYFTDAVFLFAGVALLAGHDKKKLAFLLLVIAVCILPAAVTLPTPHALRILPSAPYFIILVAIGIVGISTKIITWLNTANHRTVKWRLRKLSGVLVVTLIGLIYVTQFLYFGQYYFWVYPKLATNDWKYGYFDMYEQLTQQLKKPELSSLPVILSRFQGRPLMYYWFATHESPNQVQLADKTAKKDKGQSEFMEYKQFKIVNSLAEVSNGTAVVVGSPEEWSEFGQREDITSTSETLFTIYDLQNQPIWIGKRISQ